MFIGILSVGAHIQQAGFPDWGDVPTWLGMVAAVAAGAVAYRVYLREAERDERAKEEQRRAQAGKVAAWRGSNGTFHTLGSTVAKDELGATVRNASDLPVYDVYVRFSNLAPGPYGSYHPDDEHWSARPIHVLKPIDEVFVKLPLKLLEALERGDYRVAIEFRDAAGVRWNRHVDGKLTERRSPVVMHSPPRWRRLIQRPGRRP